jgi:hypothetical protein
MESSLRDGRGLDGAAAARGGWRGDESGDSKAEKGIPLTETMHDAGSADSRGEGIARPPEAARVEDGGSRVETTLYGLGFGFAVAAISLLLPISGVAHAAVAVGTIALGAGGGALLVRSSSHDRDVASPATVGLADEEPKDKAD